MPALTTRGQTFLALGGTVTLMGMLLGFPDITRVGVLLLALPLLAATVTWRRRPLLDVARLADPPLLPVGDRARVLLHVRNAGRRRTLLHLAAEEVDPRLGTAPRFLLPRMDPGESHRVTYELLSRSRGRHRIGPLTLRQRDPFGLTTSSAVVPSTADLVVLPRVENLGAAPLRGQGTGGEGPLPHMVALHGDDDVSVRAYRDGDDLRRVHWPTTAHRGELMVRQEDRPARRRAVLVLDARARAHRGTGAESSFEWAVTAVASVAAHLDAAGYAVHIATPETARAGTADLGSDLDTVLHALALAAPADEAAFEDTVHAAHAAAAGGALVVAAVAGWDPDALHRLASVRPPGSEAVALVLDADSFAGGRRRPDDAAGGVDAPLRAAGWRTEVVRAGDGVRAAWDQVMTKQTAVPA